MGALSAEIHKKLKDANFSETVRAGASNVQSFRITFANTKVSPVYYVAQKNGLEVFRKQVSHVSPRWLSGDSYRCYGA
jgi:hypothetical protein